MSENTAENTGLLDLDNMMGESLDTIPDAPDFVTPPAGEYTLKVNDCMVDKYKDKTGAQKQRLKLLYSVVATHSVAAGECPVADGSMFSETFQATEQALGYFKSRIKGIMNASDLTGVSLGDMMQSVKGAEFQARLTIKTSTVGDKTYENVQIRVVHENAAA